MKKAPPENNAQATAEEPYDSYIKWKGWGRNTEAPVWLKNYFAGEIKRAGIKEGARLLEVGFGNGELLRWATEAGYKIVGVEILPELVEQACSQGSNAYLLNLTEALPADHPLQSDYDGLLALDVLEHLETESSIQFLKNAAQLTRVGGRFVLRFPNGGSPFGNLPQNGDHTHRQALTEAKLRQLVCHTDWEIASFSNAYRVINQEGKGRLLKRFLFVVRDLLELGLGWTYYGRRVPMDAVATAVLVRSQS